MGGLFGQSYPDAVLLHPSGGAEHIVCCGHQHDADEEVEERYPAQCVEQAGVLVEDIGHTAVRQGDLYRVVLAAHLIESSVELLFGVHLVFVDVAFGQHLALAAVDNHDGHNHGVVGDVCQERACEAGEHVAQLGEILRLLIVEPHRHTPEFVVERRILGEIFQQSAFEFLSGEFLRDGDDRIFGGSDDDGSLCAVDDIVDIGQTESQVDRLVGVVERLQDVGIEPHLAVFVNHSLLEELLCDFGDTVALGDSIGPESDFGLFGLFHLSRYRLHLPKGEEGEHDGEAEKYQFQLIFHFS